MPDREHILRPWLDFVPGTLRRIQLYKEAWLVSYKQVGGSIVAWGAESKIMDPDCEVMFLIKNMDHKFPGLRYIITDGDRWCPIIGTARGKFRSYPSGYTRERPTTTDQDAIKLMITKLISEWEMNE